MGVVIERARKFRAEVLRGDPSAFGATEIWENLHNSLHRKAIAEVDDEMAFIELMTANNAFTYPRLIDEPLFQPVVDRYLAYFEKQGAPLGSYPAEIEESGLVSKRSSTTISGRHISTMFLHHLSMMQRISSLTTDLRKVVEIGGGYGGLARVMRLFNPKQTYIIVDLLDSLYCSYVFLSTHYPAARIVFVTNAEQASEIEGADFVFIPTQFFDILQGCSLDLVVNTASFGEMLQRDVDAYMHFINTGSNTRYFYSVNRFARFDPNMSLPDQAHTTVKLSADWEILYWDAFGARSFHQLDPCHPPQLELLAKRLPVEERLAKLQELAAALLSEHARNLTPGSSDWHYCMWEAVRLFPAKPLITQYIDGASPEGFRDAAYYRELMSSSHPTGPKYASGVDLTPQAPSAPEPQRRRWFGGLLKA